MHLPEHPHAFLNDGTVTNVAIFASHDHALIAAVRTAGGHDAGVCLCDHGSIPGIGATWDGTTFTGPVIPDAPADPPA